jgi:hypothetical protein
MDVLSETVHRVQASELRNGPMFLGFQNALAFYRELVLNVLGNQRFVTF